MMNTVPLGEVAHVILGSAPPGQSYNGVGEGLPMIAGAGDYGEQFPEPKKWTTAPTRVTEIGDLIVCVGATIGDLNWADKKYCLGRGVAGLRPKKGMLDITFAAHYINAKKNDLAKLGTGSTFPAIRRADLENFPIPLPPLTVQKRIATILDKTDVILQKRRQAIKLADEFLRSVFLDMFGDPATNPKGWQRKKIRQLGKVVTGNTPSRQILENYGEHIEWIKSDNINTPSHILTKAEEALSEAGEKLGRTVPANSTLVTCIAGTPECIGNAALADRKVAFNQQINAIVPIDNVDPYFLYMLVIISKKIIQRASTNSMKGMVSKGIFQEIELISPPYNLQKKFGSHFYAYLNYLDKQELQLKESDNLFNSLCQKAFRGEL
jgi:type I restriction enzyme S subunit